MKNLQTCSLDLYNARKGLDASENKEANVEKH